MKTKFFALALFIASVTIGYANIPVEIQKTSNPAIFKLNYVGDETSKVVVIKITDDEGNVLADRRVSSIRNFSLPLNFTKKQFGKYFVTVSTGAKSETHELAYGIESSDSASALPQIVSHTTKFKNGQYLISVPQGQTTEARVTVLDANRNVLFTTTKEAYNGAAFLLKTKNVDNAIFEISDASAE